MVGWSGHTVEASTIKVIRILRIIKELEWSIWQVIGF